MESTYDTLSSRCYTFLCKKIDFYILVHVLSFMLEVGTYLTTCLMHYSEQSGWTLYAYAFPWCWEG